MKKVLFPLLLVSTLLASCDEGGLSTTSQQKTEYDLKITFFNGGYGEDWIHNLASRFEVAKGVKVEIVKSEEGPCGADYYLSSGYNLSDIYIGEGIPWKSQVQEGYLEDLTDVYEAEVETKNGKQKIKDFMDPGIVGNFYAQRELKSTEYKPWAMPWTAKPNAMAYNEDILKEIKHTSNAKLSDGCVGTDGKWIAPPKTYDDLLAFCDDCNAFNNNSAEKQALNDTHNYVPVGWCGGVNADSLGFLIVSWWAEYQGLFTSNVKGEGSFYDFYNFGNTTESNVGQKFDINVYKQTGLKNAYDLLAKLLTNDKGEFINTLHDPYNTNLQQLQQLFVANKVSEKPVLAIASSYLENEVIKNQFLDSDQDGKRDVNFKFMNVPKLDVNSDDLLYLNFSDSMIVPAKAPHKDLAKEFLIFMSSEEEVGNFAKDTSGGIRPFQCDVRTDVTGFEYTEFTNSLFDVYYNSKHVYEYPCNAKTLAGVSHVFRYGGGAYLGALEWLQIVTILKNPEKNRTIGQIIIDTNIEALNQSKVSDWIRKFKLTDVNK